MSQEGGSVVVVLTTGPDRETLMEIGRKVVEDRLAACVNILDGVLSVYRWEGRIEEEPEAMAILKTSEARLSELEAVVRKLHPYSEPEFLVLPVSSGSTGYLAWVMDSVSEELSEEEPGR